jgi:hypothetical protein
MMIAIIPRATKLLLIAMILTGPVNAQDVTVEGQLDCSQWVEARERGASDRYEHYLIGIINGLALGHQVEFWEAKLPPISREAVYVWMDGYCRQNPLNQAVQGAIALYSERSGWRP